MTQITLLSTFAILCALGAGQANAGEIDRAKLGQLTGQPVEISPWTYVWRADRAVQEKPEAYFIPRRLERIDTFYRTAKQALSPDDLKSLYYDQPDILTPLPPKPKGALVTGMLWTGGLVDYQVELCWPANANALPAPESVEVRVYPTSWGWFGWTVDRILARSSVSADGKTWTYASVPGQKMDYAYSRHVDAATEMVAVFCESGPAPAEIVVPSIRIIGPSLGQWKRADLEIEWGFNSGAETADFDGRIETRVAMTGPIAALPEDKGTTVTASGQWRSKSAGAGRRGVVVPVLYAPNSRLGLDSRITVHTGADAFTFRVSDLDKGPILVADRGVFITKPGGGATARQYVETLAAKHAKSIRELTRERRETASWDEVMKEVRLWTVPTAPTLAPFPVSEPPVMDVQLSDPGWTSAWRAGSAQLKGPNMWGGLAHEVGRVVHAMDLVGLHAEADKVYDHFLKSPGIKSDGDYPDGAGSLEWAASLRHDMGYSHDGTHASTGRILFAMAERYFLTGDKAWFDKIRPRLQAAADWIIRQRKLYMMNVPGREDLFVAGLMPPCMLGDYALPACDWHWYYSDNAFAVQGLQRFADALAEFDASAGNKYRSEAQAFRDDLHRIAKHDAALSPVRPGRDGAYHSYIPRMAYARGLTGLELGAPQYSDSELDSYVGALPLAEPYSALEPNDPTMRDTLDVMSEMTASDAAIHALAEQRKAKGLPADDAWFWMSFVSLPKISHIANIFLLQDDVPNFLRFWSNAYATMVGADGKLWEHWHLGNFDNCSAPDNGTAGWFMENFRDLLVMEDGPSLWIARATPRAWLEQGKTIAVKNAPTYFGDLAYTIVSDVDHGKITATITVPNRNQPKAINLRLRHPKASPIRSVTVNGQPYTDFDPAKEVIHLQAIQGPATVEAHY